MSRDIDVVTITGTEYDDLLDRITALEAERDALREGLKGLYEDVLEYQRINNLGGYDNHWMKIARALLKEPRNAP